MSRPTKGDTHQDREGGEVEVEVGITGAADHPGRVEEKVVAL
jgi:hypothetical protein